MDDDTTPNEPAELLPVEPIEASTGSGFDGDEAARVPTSIGEYLRAIEAVVMVAHDPVPPDVLAQLLERPVVDIETWCEELGQQYRGEGRGFELVRVAGGYRYQTHIDQVAYVERFLLHDQRARLSGAALETLAIVAYKQPISRAQIASIRGVDPDGVLRTLQSRGYVDAVGRDNGPGQAVLFGTTSDFLERLGLDSISELPPIAEYIPGADVVEALEAGLRVRGPEPDVPSPELPDGERLQKVLAARGWGSRRVSEDLIADGRVTVNGEVAVLGRRVDPETDLVEIDGAPVGTKAALVYYLYNKPVGVVTTAHDPHGRPTVIDAVPPEPRVFSVGRLDADSEGLLIITNDGELANRVMHPSTGVEKDYLVTVGGGPVRPAAIRTLRTGVELDDGPTAAAEVSQPSPGVLRITVHEGRNRQIRRMCEAVGHPVTRLVRTRIGPISDRQLRPGTWRELTEEEVRHLAMATATPAKRQGGTAGSGRGPRRYARAT